MKNWLLGLFWHDHWVVYDQFLLLYIIYAIFNLDDYVLGTVVKKSKLEKLVISIYCTLEKIGLI